MWADGGDYKYLQFLTEDRPAGGQVVGRRAYRGADDQSITAEGGDFFVVNTQFDIEHFEGATGGDGDFVESQVTVHGSIAAVVRALVHEVFDDGVLAGAEQVQSGLEFLGAEICEEAESSEIDAEDWELSCAELAAAAKDAAVPTEDDHHIRFEIRGDWLCGTEFTDEADIGLRSKPGLEHGPAAADMASVAAGEDDEFQRGGRHGVLQISVSRSLESPNWSRWMPYLSRSER